VIDFIQLWKAPGAAWGHEGMQGRIFIGSDNDIYVVRVNELAQPRFHRPIDPVANVQTKRSFGYTFANLVFPRFHGFHIPQMYVERLGIEQIGQGDRMLFSTADTERADEARYVDFA
jgi:hypothetical protein